MAVLDAEGVFFRGGQGELLESLAAGALRFHEGRIRGAWPGVR